MDWPSRELSQRLAEWRLCTPQDEALVCAAVKGFLRDLPSFDSIWIDVLLQKRLLTPYQARILDSADPDRLVLSGHVISDCVEENAWRAVYRARAIDGQSPLTVTVHGVHPEDRTRAIDAIDATIARLRGAAIPGLNIPHSAEVGGRELLVFSPNVSGSPLRELLVRRGRFPESAVMAVIRQIIASLVSLEERGMSHGDLRARNVWLDEKGQVHVLHAGVLPAVMPTFLASQEVPIEVCDGVAPEIATGAGADSVSDQYSLGCLVWQLLAGRAPFPTGDPHGKVAAHRTKSVPDVRDFAPQVSERLGQIVARLTARSRIDRFASFRELAIQVGSPTPQDRRLLARFFRTFESDAPTQTARITAEKSKQLPSALAAVVIGGATVWLFTSDPASFSERSRKRAEAVAPKSLPDTAGAKPIVAHPPRNDSRVVQTSGLRQASTIQTLPSPDAEGVIPLVAGVTYVARSIKVSGPIVIRAPGDGPARVVIRDAAWEITADSVRMENVQVDCLAPVHVQSRGLEVLHCVLNGAGDLSTIEWRPHDPAAVSPGALLIVDSHVAGGGLSCAIRPSQVRFVNCLKTGGGSMLQLPAAGRAHQATPVQVIHTTLRGAGPLLEWAPGSRALGLRVDLTTKACVFAPHAGSPVLALTGSLAPPEWERTITVKGLESLLLSGARIVDLAPAKGKPRAAIDDRKLDADGLMTATIEFFGPNAEDAASSSLRSTDATFSVDNPPGIDAPKLATLKRP